MTLFLAFMAAVVVANLVALIVFVVRYASTDERERRRALAELRDSERRRALSVLCEQDAKRDAALVAARGRGEFTDRQWRALTALIPSLEQPKDQ